MASPSPPTRGRCSASWSPPTASRASCHHSVRLFIGSGMPVGLWRRVQERFRPARVLEFYAATEAGAILVNLNGAKLGAMGRPLPGSAEVRVAGYDVAADRYTLGREGFVTTCGPGEIGMLLVRARPGHQTNNAVLRGVFNRGDAWIETGDLFRRDADGDYWRVDGVSDVVKAQQGPVYTGPIRDALGVAPGVEVAVAYGVAVPGAEHPIAVAAVTLGRGAKLETRDLTRVLGVLPRAERPQVVRVIDAVPVTTWYRPLTGSLREEGIPAAGSKLPAWYLDSAHDSYRPLSAAARRRLAGTAAGRAAKPPAVAAPAATVRGAAARGAATRAGAKTR